MAGAGLDAALAAKDAGGALLVLERQGVLGGSKAIPIPDPYVTRNITATVMGRKYLGVGASIGNTMTFGYIAARHAAGSTNSNRAAALTAQPMA